MVEIIIHDIRFTLADGLELDEAMRERLERAALGRLSRKIIVSPWPWPDPENPGRKGFNIADAEEIAAGYPEHVIEIGGVKCSILRAGDPPVELTEDDIACAVRLLTESAFVHVPFEGDELGFIDFD